MVVGCCTTCFQSELIFAGTAECCGWPGCVCAAWPGVVGIGCTHATRPAPRHPVPWLAGDVAEHLAQPGWQPSPNMLLGPPPSIQSWPVGLSPDLPALACTAGQVLMGALHRSSSASCGQVG